MPTLVFEIEDGSRVLAPLDGRTTIGSAEGNDVVAEREDVAAQHAEIFLGLDDAWWVRDHGSPAGTFINGTRITTQRLRPGDLLLFGSISARFSMDAEAVAVEPPSPSAIDPDIENKKIEIAKLDEALTRAKAEFEQTIKEQESRLAKLRDEAAQLEPAMGSKRQQLSGLDAALAKAMADLEKTTRDEQERVATLRSEAAGLETAVGSRKQDLTVLGSALAKAQEEMERAAKIHESRVAELQEHASGLESDIGRKKQEITGLSGALEEAGKIADENRIKNEELTKSVTEAAARHEVLSHQVRTLSEQQRIKLVEMERLEQDLASLESRKSATAGVLEEHEAGRQRAEESLKQAALQREQTTAELEILTGEKNSLTDDVRRLDQQRGSLGQELADLAARKSEMRGSIDDLEQRYTELQKLLNAETEKIAGESARLAKLQTEAGEVAAQIQTERNEADSLTSTRENLIALNQQLQSEVAVVGSRLAEMSRTEERLLESRRELHQTETAHLSLTNAHDELTRQHAATEQAALHLASHIAELQKTHDQLEQAIPALRSSHDEAEQTSRTLTDEIARLRANATGEQTRLDDLLQKIDHAQRRQIELEAATKHLGDVQAQLQSAELEKTQLEARIHALVQDSSTAQLRLAEFESAEKSAGLRVSQLTLQETELQNAIKQLSDEQRRERQRFEELRSLSQDAERETNQQQEELTAQLTELHAEIAKLETRLMHARSWNAELDQLYEKLGRMPDASPEARETWLEIQRRKNDISDQLPSGIQVRPQSRPTVVPRSR